MWTLPSHLNTLLVLHSTFYRLHCQQSSSWGFFYNRMTSFAQVLQDKENKMSPLSQKPMVNNVQWSIGKQPLLCFMQLKARGVSWFSCFLISCIPAASSPTFIPISLSFPLLNILFFEIPSDFYSADGIIMNKIM